jgi:Fe-S-cluster containining protein
VPWQAQEDDVSKPWYVEGLRFGCTRCGQCCTGAPGYVWVTQQDIERMAAAKGMSAREFYVEFVVDYGERMSLAERANYDCVLLEDGLCSVYAARPMQCRTFPFWADNLKSRRAWRRTGRECPGIDQGRLYSLEQIQRILQRQDQTQEGVAREANE